MVKVRERLRMNFGAVNITIQFRNYFQNAAAYIVHKVPPRSLVCLNNKFCAPGTSTLDTYKTRLLKRF
jgi:hypothetical protein